MNEQNLETLYAKKEAIEKEFESVHNVFSDKQREYAKDIAEINSKIQAEKLAKEMSQNKDVWIEEIKKTFETTQKSKVTDELWMVEVNGKKLRSNKGKYTWTSYNRAFRGVCDYLYFNDYKIGRGVDNNTLDLGAIIEELIDSDYIKIIRVV